MSSDDTGVMEDLESPWPTADERAFIEVHPLRGATVAEHSDERLHRMINGFCEAAHVLVEQSETEPHSRRNFIYPVVFLYRQSLELHLKYFLMAYGPLAGEVPNFCSHNLEDLWSSCKRLIAHFDSNPTPADKQTFQAVDDHIAEFDAIDPHSDALRFAHDTKGRPIRLPMATVDLPNLRKVVSRIHNFLECVDWQLRYGYQVTPCGH